MSLLSKLLQRLSSLRLVTNVMKVRFAEAALVNGFGLKPISCFLNLPFLTLQRDVLLGALQRNEQETAEVYEEFALVSVEQTYETYLQQTAVQRNKSCCTTFPSTRVHFLVHRTLAPA